MELLNRFISRAIFMVKRYALWITSFNARDRSDPVLQYCNISINTGEAGSGAFVAPGYNAVEFSVGHERSTRVTVAGILSSCRNSRAEHSCCDTPVLPVGGVALVIVNDVD
jgi:hypothetical protein